jgi:endonuclease YncB( thermonuclease family)
LVLKVFVFPAFADSYTGKVIVITDGDTLTMLIEGNRQVKVRLAEIDTPESNQPYGTRSKQTLSKLVFGKNILVKAQGIDRYGRTIGRVYVGNMDVNAEMIRQGAAWVYRKYSKDTSLLDLEAEAKAKERGLWSLPEVQRTPPWEWRVSQRKGSSTSTPSKKSTPSSLKKKKGFTCAGKTKCAQMSSCEEAYFYLEKCGLNRLDRDKDGIPCETLCR